MAPCHSGLGVCSLHFLLHFSIAFPHVVQRGDHPNDRLPYGGELGPCESSHTYVAWSVTPKAPAL